MFKSELILRALTPDLWAFEEPLIWKGSDCTITIPAGFITDLASIPRLFRNLPLTDVDGISRRPAALHDGLYSLGRSKGKAYADNLLREALMVEGLSSAGAAIYYYGVHWFGGPSYASDAREGIYDGIETGDVVSPETYQGWVKAGANIFS